MYRTLMPLPVIAALFSLFLTSAININVNAAGVSTVAKIGSVPISLPIPRTFIEPSAGVPEVRALGETITPPTNRLLTILVPGRYETQIRSGNIPELDRYFLVQTPRKNEASSWTTADFSKLKIILRGQHQQILNRATPQIQRLIDSTLQDKSLAHDPSVTDLRVGEISVQEIFDEKSNSISLLALTKYTVRSGDKIQEQPMAMAYTTLLIKGKIVFLYAYSYLRSPADIDWVRTQTKIWLSQVGAEN